MMGIPPVIFYFMPKSELSDLIDAANILNGFCDEYIVTENNYIPVELR